MSTIGSSSIGVQHQIDWDCFYDEHNEKKKKEQLDEIGDGATLSYKKTTDKETGESFLVQKVASKDGENSYDFDRS